MTFPNIVSRAVLTLTLATSVTAHAAADGVFTNLPRTPTANNEIRIFGSGSAATDPLLLTSKWIADASGVTTPEVNGYTLLDSKSFPINYTFPGDATPTTTGTVFDKVYLSPGNTILFASRVSLLSDLTANPKFDTDEIVLSWRQGFTGYNASVAWYQDGAKNSRLKAAAYTNAVFGSSTTGGTKTPDSLYDPNYVGIRTEADVHDGTPSTGWLLTQTNATSYSVLSNALHLQQVAGANGSANPARDYYFPTFVPSGTAVPEPSQIATLFAGLTTLSLMARRRKK